MATTLVATNETVNIAAVDSASRPGYARAVQTSLEKRIELVLAKTGWSQRELSRRAGLGETHVGLILRAAKKNPTHSVELKTLQGIAAAAGVSLAWLSSGEGGPELDGDSPGPDDSGRTPTTTDDPEPIMRNVPGWANVVAIDTAEHDITPEEVEHGEKIAAYMLHRPAVPGDLWEIVQQVRRVNDPVWLATKLQESHQRVQALLAKAPEQLAWEREQIAKKQAKGNR